jgi:FMN phosphatase YigB (HAD superfamily)
MSIKLIMFDLDGTLLPMNQNEFVKIYFEGLTNKFIPKGYEPKKLMESIWLGIKEMVKNDGSILNEKVFWNKISSIYGNKIYDEIPSFEEYYLTDFIKAKEACNFTNKANEIIKLSKKLGYKVVLATNPIFPSVATKQRIKWAGLEESDFELVTTYENSTSCKPNLRYYQEIMNKFNVTPEECVMIGNDATEDMISKELGIKVFLLKDCLINSKNVDISKYPQGSFEELEIFIKNL